MKPTVVALFLLAFTLTASADTVADIRSAVTALQALAPARATFELQRYRKSQGRFANNQSRGGITVAVSSDSTGVQLTFSPELLERAALEASEHEADPKKPTPSRAAISEVDATTVADSLDFRAALLRLLAIAKPQTETRVTLHGAPAR
jgi:hypothetical protein